MSQFGFRLCNALKQINSVLPFSLRSGNSSVISVRWRKHRFVPKTQSKIFYVRKPTPIREDEKKIMHQKYSVYNTKMKALRSYFVKAVDDERRLRKEYEMTVEADQERQKFRVAMEINKKWNEESANIRKARESAEALENSELRLKAEARQASRDERQMSVLKAKIDEHIQMSDKFITEENIDEEIEKVLDSRQNYNFPIDRLGRRRDGKKVDTTKVPNS